MPRVDRTACCVPQCKSLAYKNLNISFHRFPQPNTKEMLRRKQWIHVLKINKDPNLKAVVCSRHFVESDFLRPGSHAKRRALKCNAVPSQNLPLSSTEAVEKTHETENRFQKRKERYSYLTSKHSTHDDSIAAKVQGNVLANTDDTEAVNIILEFWSQSGMHQEDISNAEPSRTFPVETVSTVIKEELQQDDKEIVTFKNELKYSEANINVGTSLQQGDLSRSIDFENKNEDSGKKESSRNDNCRTLPRKRKLIQFKHPEPKVSKRDAMFGLLISSELSTLSKNPLLYLETKQIILKAISNAQIQLLNSNS